MYLELFSSSHSNEKSVKYFINNITMNRDNPVDWYNMGVILGKEKKFKDAIDSYNKALSLNPDEPEPILINKAITLDMMGNHNKAIFSFDEILKSNRNSWKALPGKGLALDNLKEYKKSMSCFKKAQKVSPKNHLIFTAMGLTLKNLAEYKKAVKYFDMAIKVNRDYPRAWSGKGIVLYRLKKNKKALSCFNIYKSSNRVIILDGIIKGSAWIMKIDLKKLYLAMKKLLRFLQNIFLHGIIKGFLFIVLEDMKML